jgi:hypothetical protein
VEENINSIQKPTNASKVQRRSQKKKKTDISGNKQEQFADTHNDDIATAVDTQSTECHQHAIMHLH